MTESEPTDIEREKNKSFEIGQIGQLEDIADELRERAGKLYANKSSKDTTKARYLKEVASGFEDRASERREQWEQKYE